VTRFKEAGETIKARKAMNEPGRIIDWLVELLESNGAEVTDLVEADSVGSEIEFVRDDCTYSLLISERGSKQGNEKH
jgi:hypothetical protein